MNPPQSIFLWEISPTHFDMFSVRGQRNNININKGDFYYENFKKNFTSKL